MLLDLVHRNCCWGYAFVSAKGRISEADKNHILIEAIEMLYNEVSRRKIATERYEGVIYSAKRYEVLGGLAGHRFDARIDGPKGRVELSFLISDQTGLEQGVSKN